MRVSHGWHCNPFFHRAAFAGWVPKLSPLEPEGFTMVFTGELKYHPLFMLGHKRLAVNLNAGLPKHLSANGIVVASIDVLVT